LTTSILTGMDCLFQNLCFLFHLQEHFCKTQDLPEKPGWKHYIINIFF
jgi:hypothetical protein